jgi:hypothetical protein
MLSIALALAIKIGAQIEKETVARRIGDDIMFLKK